MLTVPHAHINALNDVLYARIYPAALLFQGWDVTCVYYHSLRNASHTNSIAFHSIHKCICKSPHTVIIVFWHVTVLLLPHQGLFMPKCVQCTSLFYDQTIQGWAVLNLCLSTLLCLIYKGVMKMVAPLLWKCNIAGCLQKWISGLLSFISLHFTAKSIKWWWAHNTEHRRSALVTGMLSEGHRDVYRDVCSPVCFYWNHSSCHVEISQTNTRQSFIRIHVLSTT